MPLPRAGDDRRPRRGIVRALLSDTYGIINNLDVLMAMLDGLQQATSESGHDDAGGGAGGGDGAAGVEITSRDLTPNRMYVAVRSNTVTAMAPQLLANYVSPFTGAWGADNPVVFWGFILANSETGKGRYTITPRLTVQVCDNGLQLEKHAIGRRHVGARMDEGQIRWSADTEQTNLALIGKQTRDAVQRSSTRIGWRSGSPSWSATPGWRCPTRRRPSSTSPAAPIHRRAAEPHPQPLHQRRRRHQRRGHAGRDQRRAAGARRRRRLRHGARPGSRHARLAAGLAAADPRLLIPGR